MILPIRQYPIQKSVCILIFSADLNRCIKNIFLLTPDEIEEKVISLTKGQFVCKSKFNPDLKMKKNENCASKVFT